MEAKQLILEINTIGFSMELKKMFFCNYTFYFFKFS